MSLTMIADPLTSLRVLKPANNILAFYDGRVSGRRLFPKAETWVDRGAFDLGISSYAVVAGEEALVFDAHLTLAHARFIRNHLAAQGVRRFRLVLSHWHLDHVAGNAVFADCEIIACRETDALLRRHKAAIEAGTKSGPPAIAPLVLPTMLYADHLDLTVGNIAVELHQMDIHSRDGTVMFFPESRLLLAGDTVEDPITYVAEPERLAQHLIDLERLAAFPIDAILPNHGSAGRIAAGGYDKRLIAATQAYVERLLRCRDDPTLSRAPLAAFMANAFASGGIEMFDRYEAVHRANIAAVLAV